ncbi:MAG: threonine synthase [Acidobacteria bacterium]|jgi:threonine synthase|nr:threonine synthase [Acidobacteriota bacterium]
MATAIRFYSTNRRAPAVGFREALLKGLAPDKGLYMPERIPRLSAAEIAALAGMDYAAIADLVCGKFLRGQIPESDLAALARDAYDFPVPLEPAGDRCHVMRLDQGPTASFKDFAARMMGRLINYYLLQGNERLLILTATSGDTGSAIANAFFGLKRIQVLVLFPDKEVTARQRKQMTTLGGNVSILAVDGKFDHCQALVKEAFSDPELAHMRLSSANSINIGRLLPQIVYYFYAHSRLRRRPDEPVVFSVPSGNFGDMMGGVLAVRMGLPVRRLVIATNENDEFPGFVASGDYRPIAPSRNCISSAMNVGHPSNLARLIDLYGGSMDEKGHLGRSPDMERLRRDIFAVSITEAETRQAIRSAYERLGLLLEPHGAVGWAGLQKYLQEEPAPGQLCVSLETAHPAKFPEEIRSILGFDPPLPPSLEGLEAREESFATLASDYPAFKEFLQKKYS